MNIAVDSCSIILLSKATVLESFAKNYNLYITEEVYKEILEGKDKKFIDALLTEKLVNENKIKIIKVNNKRADKLIEDFNLSIGEAKTLSLLLENKCEFIVTDNKQGRKAAVIYSLNLSGSIDVVVSLYRLKIIDKEKAISALKKLHDFGWFNEYLVENAMEDIKNE